MFKPLTYDARKGPPRRQDLLRNTTLREFGGGWNVVDNDLNLSSRYAKVFRNVFRSQDGTVSVRPGTRLFADLASSLETIINIYYYRSSLIAVGSNGKVVAVDGTGNFFEIWNDEIAGTLPGSPNGWSTELEFCSFAQFRGQLIVCNGIDKPIIINQGLVIEYLNDLATGSNLNTPVGRYVATSDRYTVIAGIPGSPSLLSISAIDTSGTYLGDPSPNDAVEFELGSYVSMGSNTIKGVHTFRERLIVAFEEVILVIQLGVYDGADHTPQVDDVVPQYGTVSHRAVQDLGDDMYFCDIRGVPSVKRSVFTQQIKPTRESQLIDPAMHARLKSLTQAALEDRIFSVYNRKEGQYMLFVPNNSNPEDITETIGFIYTRIEALGVKAWAEIRGWNWRCGCRSSLGRVFFCNKSEIYVLGDDEDVVAGDYVLSQETWSDETIFSDGTGWGVTAVQLLDADAEETTGIPISFDWQLPWADNEQRNKIKQLRHLFLDTQGSGSFHADVFVDNILTAPADVGESFLDDTFFLDGYGWESEDRDYSPALSIEYRGGDAPGFGLQPFGVTNFGGGRRSNDERLMAATAKYKIIKLRMHGETRFPLKFISVSMDYLLGSIRR